MMNFAAVLACPLCGGMQGREVTLPKGTTLYTRLLTLLRTKVPYCFGDTYDQILRHSPRLT